MKVRNGFVSNSSSSSFILAYGKNNVLTDPKDIINYIKENPNKEIIFRGFDCGEGDDIFELTDEQKSLILKFPKEFIATNTNTRVITDYTWDPETDTYAEKEVEVPCVEAYTGDFIFKENEHQWRDYPEVDMNDWETPVDYDWLNDTRTDEEKNYANKYWCEYEKRRRLAYKALVDKQLEEALNDLASKNVPDVYAKEVLVSNRSCSEDYYDDEFTDRYLTMENSEPYEENCYCVKKYKSGKAVPFAIIYNENFTEKTDIISHLESSSAEGDIICWTNPVLNSKYNEDNQYDFFKLGKEERKYLLENKEAFLNSSREVVLFTKAYIYKNAGYINFSMCKNMTLGFGKVIVLEPSQDMFDFKKQLKEM